MDELDHFLLNIQGHTCVQPMSIRGGNGGAYLIEYMGNYYWVPMKIISHLHEESGTMYVYGKIWVSILKRTDPEEREKWSLWV